MLSDGTLDREAPTLSAKAAEAISAAIIRGDLQPGARLGIRELTAQLHVGPTPIREALTGLAGRGLVIGVGQRGFRVAAVSAADLRDLIAARTVIETGALRLAIAAGDAEWEAGIAAALQRQKHFSRSLPPTIEARIEMFERLNRDFHTALIAACGSARLIALNTELHRQAQRYRNLMLRVRDISPNTYKEHRQLADLTLARDADAACARLTAHNKITFNLIYGNGEVFGEEGLPPRETSRTRAAR